MELKLFKPIIYTAMWGIQSFFHQDHTSSSGFILACHRVRQSRNVAFTPLYGLEINEAKFEKTIRAILGAKYVPVTLADVSSRIENPKREKWFCVTFDDAYKELTSTALPILKRYGVPSTLFVVSSFAYGTGKMWWLEVEKAIQEKSELTVSAFRRQIRLPCNTEAEKRRAFLIIDRVLQLVTPTSIGKVVDDLTGYSIGTSQSITKENCMNWDDLRRATRNFDVEIGAHSNSHFNLKLVNNKILRSEVEVSRDAIKDEIGIRPYSFAYPYGAATEREAAVIKDAGFTLGLTMQTGLALLSEGQFRVSRLDVNSAVATKEYFEVFGSGLIDKIKGYFFPIRNEINRINESGIPLLGQSKTDSNDSIEMYQPQTENKLVIVGPRRLRGALVFRLAAGLTLRIINRVVGYLRFRSDAVREKKSRHVMFVHFETALGSAVHATPMFEVLKKHSPEIIITVACSQPMFDVLQHNPYIGRVVKVVNPVSGIIRSWLDLWKLSSDKNYDCVLIGPGNNNGSISAAVSTTGLKPLVGLSPLIGLLDTRYSYNIGESVIYNNLNILKFFGCYSNSPVEPSVFFSRENVKYAVSLLIEQGCQNGKPILALITQTSGGQPTKWHSNKFVELADKFADQGFEVVFTGTAAEVESIDQIRKAMRNQSISVAGRTSICELAALLCHCDLAISLDTGPMHVARSVGLPMVVIAPAWQPDFEWLPIECPQIEIIRKNDIFCRHCRKLFCQTMNCISDITVIEVYNAAIALLGKYPSALSNKQARVSRLVA